MSSAGKIVLFALSTCPACRKTKELLNRFNVDYILVELDTIETCSRNKLLEQVRKYNPHETFPTLVVDGGKKVIVGYAEDEIKEALGLL
ncbi:glutaredoxin [bacterium BMS3Bbin06]|nr:glutaredoxin [bacterium BMS3Abin08]GBE34265.1 glutaredoxin [bacterium BMS3Bbin06]HDO34857.1 glutaredoxin [Nitrospirota bacterium]HDY71641.1 glutaredoxin [Nitrospirota bacterium]